MKRRAIYIGKEANWGADGYLNYGMTGTYDVNNRKFISDDGIEWADAENDVKDLYFPRG